MSGSSGSDGAAGRAAAAADAAADVAADVAADEVRTAELLAALSLATDLGMGYPLEHGLHGTLVGMRLCDRLGVDRATAGDVYYGCLLFYVGCTADAELAAEQFPDGLGARLDPVKYGRPPEAVGAIVRSLAGSGPPPARAARVVRRLPRTLAAHPRHLRALCEVGRLLGARLGVGPQVGPLFSAYGERWDGRGTPGRLRGDALPLPLRIAQVARDATYQRLIGGHEHAVSVTAYRAGCAFDPTVVAALLADADAVLAGTDEVPAWEAVLDAEPRPARVLAGPQVDAALAAMGDFADLVAPYLVGHSAAVAGLAGRAARACGLPAPAVRDLRRAGSVADLGRVAVSAGVWQKPGPLTPDESEQVRLHAYHSERLLCRSEFLAPLLPAAGAHHERLDGSGYHRGSAAPGLGSPARLLAATDVYVALTSRRPHRAALPAPAAARALEAEAAGGRLDERAVAAVLEAAGHAPRPVERPAGLTEREVQVVALLARGLQTKQVGRALQISAKTADHHVQHAYAKIGVSTRAAAAVWAMEHDVLAWGELPMSGLAAAP